MRPDLFAEPDPRYVDDGLARVVDELELAVVLELYPVRYLTGLPAPTARTAPTAQERTR